MGFWGVLGEATSAKEEELLGVPEEVTRPESVLWQTVAGAQ